MNMRSVEAEDREQIEAIFDKYWFDSFRDNLSSKLDGYLKSSPEVMEQNFNWLVAEEDGQVIGVMAYRDVPEHMREFTSTSKPVEFYVGAVRERNRGVGTQLLKEELKQVKEKGYTEAIFFSGETHQESWPFHDNSGFVRVAEMEAPNGEKGYVWRLELE